MNALTIIIKYEAGLQIYNAKDQDDYEREIDLLKLMNIKFCVNTSYGWIWS